MAIISQHTSASQITILWKNPDGTEKNMTGVTSVTGVMRLGDDIAPTDTTLVGTISIVDASIGHFLWTVNTVDADNIGKYRLFLYATFASGEVQVSLPSHLEILNAPTPP